jgi:V/A-type H+-transporting ATPase subunit I
LRGELDFETVLRGLGEKEDLVFLKGFCPADQLRGLTEKAKEEQWGILIEDPTDADDIPTLLKNPKWVNIIKPVFRFVDILPGYKEVDASLIFLVFFSIFFGMLIGDAAYGLIFAAVTFFCQMKTAKKLKDRTIFYLLYTLSGCTVVWGLLTGTFFGQAWLTNKAAPLVPWLLEFNNIIFLCFLIGAVHLSIARFWQMVLRFPSITFLGQAGWVVIVWTVFFAAKMFVLNHAFPPYGAGMLISGALMVIFFTEPIRNPLKVLVPRGLGFMMSLVNAFADVVSYIRLFAVGLATVAIADAFNEMATGVGFNNVFTTMGAALILIIGHVLNMVLAGLAVLVHGIRLNVLEFSGHLNLEWSGRRYTPFRRVEENNS